MFLEDDLLDIVVFYRKKGRHYICYGSDDFEKSKITPEEKEKFEKLSIKAKPLTFGLYNDMQESALVPDNLGNKKWNYKVYKENKLIYIISQWDAKIKDVEGKMVTAPINRNTIAKMSPDVAETILNIYDKLTLIEDDEEKKS